RGLGRLVHAAGERAHLLAETADRLLDLVAQPLGLGLHRVAYAGTVVEDAVDHRRNLAALAVQHLGEAPGGLLGRGLHRRRLVLAGLAQSFALLLHHAGDLVQEPALLCERALDLLATGARGLRRDVDVAGLGAEQGARAIERGSGFLGR